MSAKETTGSEAFQFHEESTETDWFLWRMQRQRHNSLAVNRGEGGEEQKNMDINDKEGRIGSDMQGFIQTP